MRWLCLGALIIGLMGCKDSDSDGTRDKRDCSPTDPLVNPDAKEVCDGVDNDCDGQIDEDVSFIAYWDRDQDGFGDEAFARRVCTLAEDGAETAGDCNDFDPAVYPGAPEVCDGFDNDCDDEVDEDVQRTFYEDLDGDGHGTSASTAEACWAPPGFAATDDDCDDAEPLAWTDRVEDCDGVDNDCDGAIDEDAEDTRQWADLDGDGFGDPNNPVIACGPGDGVSDNDLDCDDADPARHPDAIETRGDSFDEDCDGFVDEYGIGPGNEFSTWQDALAAAPDGAVVQFDAGLFLDTVDLTGRDVVLAGEGCDRTVLYGDAQGSTITMDAGIVNAITVSGGNGTDVLGDGNHYGGGVLITGGSPAIHGACLTGNSTDYYGGGVSVWAGSATIVDSLIAQNSASYRGGGVHVALDARADIHRTRIAGNSAFEFGGGGVYVRGGAATLTNSVIAGNTCPERGCGVLATAEYNTQPEATAATEILVDQCTFHANGSDPTRTSHEGEALEVQDTEVTEVTNSLMTGHPFDEIVFGERQTSEAPVLFFPTMVVEGLGFDGNTGPDRDFYNWQPGRLGGDARYLFVDSSYPPAEWDLRLQALSDFVDLAVVALDPDGSPADLGAYGGPAADPAFDIGLAYDPSALAVFRTPGTKADWDHGLSSDQDGDGMLDGWERAEGLNPWVDDAADDEDADGLDNIGEHAADTRPFVSDSDDDGEGDGSEVPSATDALDPRDHAPGPDAGGSRWGVLGEQASFDGGGSFDPDGSPLVYAWTVTQAPAGATATLTDPAAVVAEISPDAVGTWELTLEVTDAAGAMRSDVVTLDVVDPVIVPDDVATIQEAVDSSPAGGSVIGVRPGTWVENVDLGANDVTLIGLGATPDEVVIDGSRIDSVIQADGGALTLANLTLTGGLALEGGGLRAEDLDRLDLFDVSIEYNEAIEGGGLWIDNATLRATDVVIAHNTAVDGGGLWYLDQGAGEYRDGVHMDRLRLLGNEATDRAGGMLIDGGTSSSSQVDFLIRSLECVGNRSGDDGACWWHSGLGSDLYLFNAVVAANDGLSVTYSDQGRTAMMGSVFAFNAATTLHEGTTGADHREFDTIRWGNAVTDVWYALAGDVLTLGTSVDVDPMFALFTLDGDPANDVFAPRAGSPMLDRGFVEFVDPDGTRSDAGPCGGEAPAVWCRRFAVDADLDGMSDGWEVMFGLDPSTDDTGDDPDGDGLTNGQEHATGTDPTHADTDRDGLPDLPDALLGTALDASQNRPVADAGGPYDAEVGTVLALDGSASSDPNADPLTFQWRVLSVPPGSALTDAGVAGAQTATPSLVPDVRGVFVLGLVVNDGAADSLESRAIVVGVGDLDIPGTYATVDEALEHARDGDTLRLAAGTWPLTLELSGRRIVVGGVGEGLTVLEGIGAEAIFVIEDDADLTVEDLTLTRSANRNGGAVHCQDGALTMRRVSAEGNAGHQGGALYLDQCISVFEDVDLVDNIAGSSGGAIYSRYGTLDWTGGSLSRNISEFSGGGMDSAGTALVMHNVVVGHNVALSTGGGIRYELLIDLSSVLRGSLDATHLTVVGNDGSLSAIYRQDATPTTLTHSLFVDNREHGFYDSQAVLFDLDLNHNGFWLNDTDTKPVGLSTGPDDVAGDPLFVDFDPLAFGIGDDYRLKAGSPMIDAGAAATDPDGSLADLGAYGGPSAPAGFDSWYRDPDGDGLPEGWELLYGLNPAAPDAGFDADGDGLDNGTEYLLGTDPTVQDTDGDGVDDGTENAGGFDPTDPSDFAPTADAGGDEVGTVGVASALTGNGTDPNGDPITYLWSFVELPGRSTLANGDLVGRTSPVVSFVPDTAGVFVLQLAVTDGTGTGIDSADVRVAGDLLVPDDYATVADAFDAIEPGFVLGIGPGTWPARLDLAGKDVTLAGAGRDQTFLDAEGMGTVLIARAGELVDVRDLTLTGGWGGQGGGASLDGGSVLTLSDVAVSANVAAEGAGIHLTGTDTTLIATDTRFVDNVATYRGAGIDASWGAIVDVQRSLFGGNLSDESFGGGVRGQSIDLTVTNAVFSDNVATIGGGIYVTSTSTATLSFITATANEANSAGTFLGVASSSIATLDHSIVTEHDDGAAIQEVSADYTQTWSLFADNVSNFSLADSLDPTDGLDGNQIDSGVADYTSFVDDLDWTNDDWTLGAASDAIDAGDPLGPADVDSSVADLGAFGGPGGDWVP